MKRLISTLIILFLLGVFQTLKAEEIYRPSDEEIVNYLEKEQDNSWYGSYYTDADGNDHKLGYLHLKNQFIENEEGGKLFSYKGDLYLSFKYFGAEDVLSMSFYEIFKSTPPFQFVNNHMIMTAEGLFFNSSSINDEEGLKYTEFNNGTKKEKFNSNVDYRLNDVLATEIWLADESPKVGDSISTKTLDENSIEIDKYTITKIVNTFVKGVPYKYYEMETPIIDDDGKESIFTVYGDEEQMLTLTMDFEGIIINSRLEAKEKAMDISYIADLFFLNSIQVDESSHDKETLNEILYSDKQIGHMTYEITGEYNNTIVESYANQSISTKNSTHYLLLGLNDEHYFEKVKAADFADANKFKDENPELTELATEIIKGAKNDLDKIELLRTWVYENIEWISEIEEVTDPYEIINKRKGDCTEITDLFNALLKSAGIPARPVTGYAFGVDSFGSHQWSEVSYEGQWFAIDATWNMWADSSLYHIKTIENDDVNFGKKYKLKLKKVAYLDGTIENF